MISTGRKKLGQLLCERSYIDESILQLALAEQQSSARRLGEILLDLGHVTPAQLIEALAVQAGIEKLDLTSVSVTADVVGLIPADFVKKHDVLPLWYEQGRLAVAMTDPFKVGVIEDLRLVTGASIRRYYCDSLEMENAILRFYGSNVARMLDDLVPSEQVSDAPLDSGDYSAAELQKLAKEPSLVNLVNLIILEAMDERASDIHIEPFEKEVKIKYRVDGLLVEKTPSSKRLLAAIVSRIKIMANMNIAERYMPQDGHIEFSGTHGRIDLRVSTVPTVFGESIVLRIMDKTAALIDLEDLGMNAVCRQGWEQSLRKAHGIVLVTGPTGCGKTTTLYASLKEIFSPSVKMITIEDPVEYQLDGICQMPVNPKRGLTFATGLRHILRHDPDVVMVGEIRDRETADIAIRAALTGHLVFSTLHTNDAAGAITRLIDMGIEPFLIASSVEAILGQRLIRKICPQCKEAYQPDQNLIDSLRNGSMTLPAETQFYHGRGCTHCNQTGMTGRAGMFELLRINRKLRDLIPTRPTTDQINRAASEDHVSMLHDGLEKVIAGLTSPDEVFRVSKTISEED